MKQICDINNNNNNNNNNNININNNIISAVHPIYHKSKEFLKSNILKII
jgi:hypothetical protein